MSRGFWQEEEAAERNDDTDSSSLTAIPRTTYQDQTTPVQLIHPVDRLEYIKNRSSLSVFLSANDLHQFTSMSP